jgi:hypothetical protein
LQDILTKYIAAEDMFTQQYLHGKNENIKLLVDIGKAVDTAKKLVCFRITMGRLLNRGRESHSTRPHRLQLYQGRMTVKGRMERCLGEITERYVLQKAL